MSGWMVQALALGVVVLALAAVFIAVVFIAFPPDDKGPRGGGMAE